MSGNGDAAEGLGTAASDLDLSAGDVELGLARLDAHELAGELVNK